MESALQFLHDYSLASSVVLSLFTLNLLMWYWWEKLSFWWLNVWYAFPVIGKESRLSRDDNIIQHGDEPWFTSEITLCRDYYQHYQKFERDPSIFQKSQDYLKKANETGRNNLHLLGWVVIFLLVILEAFGFSYVLAGYAIPGASENLQQKGAMGIAFIISVILVGLTHFTGHELHLNSLINTARSWWLQKKDAPNRDSILEPDNMIDFESTFMDRDAPQYKQLVSRLPKTTSSYYVTYLTAVSVIVIAILATYVRGQVLEQQHTRTVGVEQTMGNGKSDPFEEAPVILQSDMINAQKKVDDDAWQSEKKGGWETFVFLAFLFMLLQIFGVLIGYKTGFAGKDSADARKRIDKFKTVAEYDIFYRVKKEQIVAVAQKRLSNLQQKLQKYVQKNSNEQNRQHLANHNDNRHFLAFVNNMQAHVPVKKQQSTATEKNIEERSSQETHAVMEARIRTEIREAQMREKILKEMERGQDEHID